MSLVGYLGSSAKAHIPPRPRPCKWMAIAFLLYTISAYQSFCGNALFSVSRGNLYIWYVQSVQFPISNSGPTLSVSQSFLVLKSWVGFPKGLWAIFFHYHNLLKSPVQCCFHLHLSLSGTTFTPKLHSLPIHPGTKNLWGQDTFYSSMDPHHAALVHRRCSKISDGLINKWRDDRRDKACTLVIPKEEMNSPLDRDHPEGKCPPRTQKALLCDGSSFPFSRPHTALCQTEIKVFLSSCQHIKLMTILKEEPFKSLKHLTVWAFPVQH